jgi:hypothetical protein
MSSPKNFIFFISIKGAVSTPLAVIKVTFSFEISCQGDVVD